MTGHVGGVAAGLALLVVMAAPPAIAAGPVQGRGDGQVERRPVDRVPGARLAAPARRGGPAAEAATPAAVEALLDRLVLRQARSALQLSAEQQRQFEPRMTRLQNVRRRLQRERQRLVNDLAAATRNGGPADEAMLRQRLRALEVFRGRADQQLREAVTAIDQILSVEQQARFRVFERRIERQKLDLLARARQEAQAGGQGDTAPAVPEAP